MRLRKHFRFLLFAALACGLSWAEAARAHDAPRDPAGSFYLGGGIGAELVELEEVSAVTTLTVAGFDELGGTDAHFWSESAHVLIGFVDREGLTLPDPFGKNARVELLGRSTRGDSRASARRDAFAGAVGVLSPSDPATFAGAGGFLDFTAISFQETDLRTWEADLLYCTDVELMDGLVFSPLLGLTYTHIRLENDFFIRAQVPVGSPVTGPAILHDQTKASYGGVSVGGDLRARPFGFLTMNFGVRADLMGVSAAMRANLDAGPMSFAAETDHDSDFAARIMSSLGMTLTAGPLELDVEGFTRWLSYVPYARHPLLMTDDVSHIDDGELWSAGWRASLTVYFD